MLFQPVNEKTELVSGTQHLSSGTNFHSTYPVRCHPLCLDTMVWRLMGGSITFLTLTLDGGDINFTLGSLFPMRMNPSYPLAMRLGGPRSRSGRDNRHMAGVEGQPRVFSISALNEGKWSTSRLDGFTSGEWYRRSGGLPRRVGLGGVRCKAPHILALVMGIDGLSASLYGSFTPKKEPLMSIR